MFVVSTVSDAMEKGEPLYLAGKSGIELVKDIIRETRGRNVEIEPQNRYGRTSQYWIGWAVAYYQWRSGRKYSEIFKALSYAELERMYFTLHEADVSKFADAAEEKVKEFFPDTNLKRIRNIYGCTQSDLAKMSGVSLRSIQMYEQRKKDINKASSETLYRISKVLGCAMEDLIEK